MNPAAYSFRKERRRMSIDRDSAGTPGPHEYDKKSDFDSRRGTVIGQAR
jgi:hypothetical protein